MIGVKETFRFEPVRPTREEEIKRISEKFEIINIDEDKVVYYNIDKTMIVTLRIDKNGRRHGTFFEKVK